MDFASVNELLELLGLAVCVANFIFREELYCHIFSEVSLGVHRSETSLRCL